jgi:hypothetical protein
MPTTPPEKKVSIRFDLAPIGAGNGAFAGKMVNLNETVQRSKSQIEIASSAPDAGFRKTENYHLDGGAGVGLGMYLDNVGPALSLLGAGAGLVPVGGGSLTSSRFIKNERDLGALAQLRIPTHASDLDAWALNDSVMYQARGGILFSVGVGYAGAGSNMGYLATGEWNTYVEKTGEKSAYVKITSSKLQGLDFSNGTIVASVGTSFFMNSDNAFSYDFDLTDKAASNAYEAMIHGSVKQAQELAAKRDGKVKLNLTRKSKEKGRVNHLYFGLPILFNMSKHSGQIYNTSDTIFHEDGSKSHVEYGLYMEGKDKNFIYRHKESSKTFTGITYENTDKTGKTIDGRFAKIVFAYENNHSGNKTISDAVADMIKSTGLRKQLSVKVTEPANVTGYTLVSLEAIIPEEATERLLRVGKFNFEAASQRVNDYFVGQGDPDRLCDPEVITNSVAACRDDVRYDTVKAFKDMSQSLQNMRKSSAKNDRKAFAKAYGKFGKAMLKNQFTFQTVQSMTSSTPLEITFTAEGQKISKTRKKIQSALSDTDALSSVPLN